MFRLILLSIVINGALSMHIPNVKDDYCYATQKHPYIHFASKSAYEFIHGRQVDGRIPKCHPVQFWSINRHGTRLPGEGDINKLLTLTQVQEQIIKNYEGGAPLNGLCNDDLELIKNWKMDPSVTVNNSEVLTSQGWQDEKLLALRNKARFSEILSLPYSQKDFLFRHTVTQRTQASCQGFADGLFGEEWRNIHRESYEKDTLLQTYKNCKFWEAEVENNPESSIEYTYFLVSDVYKNMLERVSKRLGFKSTLDDATVRNIFQMCRFEQSWNIDDKSAWCSALTIEDFHVLEYGEDLIYYNKIGHGNPLNHKVGCQPLKDLMSRFNNVVNGVGNEPKGVFYFTHSSSYNLFLAAMGVMKDTVPLKSENYGEQTDRLWRTSLLGPFAANVDVVLYKCSENMDHRVVLYINEHQYLYPECSDSEDGSCSWKQFKEMYETAAQECSLDFCQNDD